ncbi:4-(cytidine 5'-diphospho)-2-C-methyl-D-erythritol kinase [Deltaproteobacteria bacterium TL4]
MQIKTPAKINTQLYILNKREDGFHELYLHMVPVSLFDTLTLTPNAQRGIHFHVEGLNIGGKLEDNLIVRAARLFEQKACVSVHLDIVLDKQIPIGAGLGGGSGNAAGMLVALNRYFGAPFSREELCSMASKLGSDVPFFIKPAPCEIQGRGEIIHLLDPYPHFPLIIVKPSFSIATADAYRHCRPEFRHSFPSIQTLADLTHNLYNQFEQTLFRDFPELPQIKAELLKNGAVGALTSGSGSAVFGVFETPDLQTRAATELMKKYPGQSYCCHTLEEHHYD